MSAADPLSVYTVTASRSASVDVTFARAVTLEPARSTVSGGRAFAGYYVQPLYAPGDKGIGEVRAVAFQHGPFPLSGVGLGRQQAVTAVSHGRPHPLPAGRYRLHVLGDAPATARLVMRGAGRSRTLRATGRSGFVATIHDMTPPVPGPAVASAELPVTVPSGAGLAVVTVYATVSSVWPAYAGAYSSCIGPADVPSRCHAGPYAPGNPDFENRVTRHTVRWTIPVPRLRALGMVTTYYAGTAPPGEQHASYTVSAEGVLDKFVVAAFSFAL